MANKQKTYKELRSELDQLMAWFDGDNLDVDEALDKYAQAEKVIAELEAYLQITEQKINKLKK